MRILDPRHLTFSVSSRFTTYCRFGAESSGRGRRGSGVGKPRRPSRSARSPGRAWGATIPTEVDGEGLARGHGDRNARTPDGSRSRGGHPVAAGSRLGWRGGAASRPQRVGPRCPGADRGRDAARPLRPPCGPGRGPAQPLRHGDGAGGARRRAEYRPRAAEISELFILVKHELHDAGHPGDVVVAGANRLLCDLTNSVTDVARDRVVNDSSPR